MVILLIAGIWGLLMVIVVALCRASARADESIAVLQGQSHRRPQPPAHRAWPAPGERGRRRSLA